MSEDTHKKRAKSIMHSKSVCLLYACAHTPFAIWVKLCQFVNKNFALHAFLMITSIIFVLLPVSSIRVKYDSNKCSKARDTAHFLANCWIVGLSRLFRLFYEFSSFCLSRGWIVREVKGQFCSPMNFFWLKSDIDRLTTQESRKNLKCI